MLKRTLNRKTSLSWVLVMFGELLLEAVAGAISEMLAYLLIKVAKRASKNRKKKKNGKPQ